LLAKFRNKLKRAIKLRNFKVDSERVKERPVFHVMLWYNMKNAFFTVLYIQLSKHATVNLYRRFTCFYRKQVLHIL